MFFGAMLSSGPEELGRMFQTPFETILSKNQNLHDTSLARSGLTYWTPGASEMTTTKTRRNNNSSSRNNNTKLVSVDGKTREHFCLIAFLRFKNK